MLGGLTWLRKLWVDGGYSGADLAQWVRTLRQKLELEVVKRSDQAREYKVLPRRWVVERTFGWLVRHRPLARDYERCKTSAESWVYIAVIRIQFRRWPDSSGLFIFRAGSQPHSSLHFIREVLALDKNSKNMVYLRWRFFGIKTGNGAGKQRRQVMRKVA